MVLLTAAGRAADPAGPLEFEMPVDGQPAPRRAKNSRMLSG
ncbi:MAG: hypothetical protein ACM3ZB_05000 [bacterium]|jgi:hypothetical protein